MEEEDIEEFRQRLVEMGEELRDHKRDYDLLLRAIQFMAIFQEAGKEIPKLPSSTAIYIHGMTGHVPELMKQWGFEDRLKEAQALLAERSSS